MQMRWIDGVSQIATQIKKYKETIKQIRTF